MGRKGKGRGRGKLNDEIPQAVEKEIQPLQEPILPQNTQRTDEPVRKELEREQQSQKTLTLEHSLEVSSKGRGRGRGRPPSQNTELPKVGQTAGSLTSKQSSQVANGHAVPILATPEKPKDTLSRNKTDASEDQAKKPVVYAKRPDYGVMGRRIPLYVNYFKLQYKNTKIYHYDIDISEVTKNRKMGKSLMSRGRTKEEDKEAGVKHVERQTERNVGKAKCRNIISEMIKSKSLKHYCPVYDGQKNLFTSKPLPTAVLSPFPLDIVIEERPKQYYVTIQPVQKSDLSNAIDLQPLLDMYNKRSSEIPDELLLVYQTILNHREPPFTQVQFRNSFFSLNSKVESIGCGLEIWSGFHQAVHLTELGPVVVINLAAKAFHKAGPVIEYAKEVLPRINITRSTRLEKWQINLLTEALRGVQVKVTHQRYSRKYKIKCVTLKPASETYFAVGNENVSVVEYFLEKYQRRLDYPHLPCLQMQSNNSTFIPMETCTVVENQPKMDKLSGDLQSRMIRSTAVEPAVRFDKIEKIAGEVNSTSREFLGAFNLLMDIELMKVDGRVIAAPQLKYDKKTNDPSQIATPDSKGVWRMEDGKRFYEVVIIKNWCLISFADSRWVGDDDLYMFCESLVRSANKCGMQMDKPRSIKMYGRNIHTEQAILEAKKSGAQFAIVVLNRGNNQQSYDEVKFLADFKHNLVTQCIDDKTLGKMKENLRKSRQNNRANDQLTTNICLKINVKLGGINHILFHRPVIFSQPVMVIGADVIHWPRAKGYCYPSIVSVVASLNPDASRYALTCHTQRNKKEDKRSQEIIINMKEIAKELIEMFQRSTKGRPPRKIIVFRDGVSESQFQAAMEEEVGGIQQACKDLFGEYIPITFIVVQKRHQTRLMPQRPAVDGVGRGQNVPPGTVVDKNIVHPVFWDFFVCSHEGIKGTSKPAHYTVLHDDNQFTSDTLQQLCHFLCHTYVRCTRSVSIPAPVLYADLAAARAKKYADLHMPPPSFKNSSSEDIEKEFPAEVNDAIKSMKSFEKNFFYV